MQNMLEALETLVVLAETGTMVQTATRLRISQSAVTKRIAALEAELNVALVERVGRRVKLTAFAEELIARTRPLLAELREALSGQRDLARGRIVLGVSESLLTSWAPRVLARARATLPEVMIELHAHRSPVAVDHVRSGEFTLALVAGRVAEVGGLWCEAVLEESMVLVGAAPMRLPARGIALRITTIEAQSETFRALAPQLKLLRSRGIVLDVERELESFAAIVQLARAGLGPALVPLPLARALGVPRAQIADFPRPGLRRPVSLVGKKSALSRPVVAAFRTALLTSVGRERLDD